MLSDVFCRLTLRVDSIYGLSAVASCSYLVTGVIWSMFGGRDFAVSGPMTCKLLS